MRTLWLCILLTACTHVDRNPQRLEVAQRDELATQLDRRELSEGLLSTLDPNEGSTQDFCATCPPSNLIRIYCCTYVGVCCH